MAQWRRFAHCKILGVVAAAMLATSMVACSDSDPSIETTQETRTALNGEEEEPIYKPQPQPQPPQPHRSYWSTLGAPMDGCGPGRVHASHQMDNGDIIVGGRFTTCGSAATNYIARWHAQTNTWSPIGGGVDGPVYAITSVGNDIYVGGTFATAGGTPVNNIAMWNGTTWNILGGGVPFGSGIQALVQSNGVVYAAGQFTQIGGISANHIAKWDGSGWSALGPGGGGTNAFILSLHAVGSTIYAGGAFNQVKYNDGSWIWANRIAVWNGSTWSALGGGIGNGVVNAVTSNRAGVYACGDFATAGNSAAAYVAMWNGITWKPMGAGFNSICAALRTFGGRVYAGGSFTQAGDITASYIALWDGTSWSPLMDGASNGVHTYDVSTISGTTDIVVAGNFTFAGSIPARQVAIWHPSPIGLGLIDGPIPGPDPVPDPVYELD